VGSSTILLGSGEGTTRRHDVPSARTYGALEGEQADLRPVAVGDDQLVARGERGDGRGHVVQLDGGVGWLAPSQQGVAT
jgi:hypothetical protein